MERKSGISLLDVIILILSIGVIAALLIPKTREKEAKEQEAQCRAKMELINKAMVDYFSTCGDVTLLNQSEEVDTSDTTKSVDKKSDEEAEEEAKPHLFTDDPELLKPYLPEGFDFTCPENGKEYILHARDSVFYSISCPNGHGQVIKGQFTWEEE